ncbi:MAG: diguanylate cyclase [Paracoccaceae bacterium]|jgi:two-component system cell cycle response regulator|nr:diguanylate cyclase [Paracoccaceae bacterium]
MAGKILIVDDVATNRIVLKVKLSGARYETIQASNGTEALQHVAQSHPDLILLDVQLPDHNGIDICRTLKADPATRGIPIVMITAFADTQTRLEALRAGADDFLVKPFDELVLLARLRSLLRAKETDEELTLRESTCRELGFAEAQASFGAPARIGLVAADRETGLMWKTMLTRFMPLDNFGVLNRDEALIEAVGANGPDAFVIAADLSRAGEGLRLMSELRSRPSSRHAVICIASDEHARETAAVALDLGASDLVPVALSTAASAEEAALRLKAQLMRKRTLDQQRENVADGLRLAVTDPLTGLYNRRYAMPHLARMAERSRVTGRQFAVMVLDLDRFKSINDTYGHAAGDAVLVEVAQRLRFNLRQVDLIARIGGEEFLVAMPETTLDAARVAAERLCRVMAQTPITLPGGADTVKVTVSIGLALGGGAEHDPVDALISLADRALLGSKADGRNQVKIFNRPSAA